MEWQKICKGDYVKRVKDRVFLLRFESKEFSKYFVLYTKTLSESKLYEIKRFRVQNSAIASMASVDAKSLGEIFKLANLYIKELFRG